MTKPDGEEPPEKDPEPILCPHGVTLEVPCDRCGDEWYERGVDSTGCDV